MPADINDYVTLAMAQALGHEVPAYVLSKVAGLPNPATLGA